MLGEGLARWALAGEGHHTSGARGGLFGGYLVGGGGTLRFLERQGRLLDQPHAALRTLAIDLVPQLGDLQLLMRDHGLVVRGARLGVRQFRLDVQRPRGRRQQCCLERGVILRQGFGGAGHGE